jgi:iron complex outermembrane receptor protein
MKLLQSASVLTLVVFAPSLATAQASPAAASGSEDVVAQVEEVIVTAQKREQSLQSVAAAVSAVGAEAIQRRGITDTTNLQFFVPSLVAGKIAGVTAVSIRGVGLNQYGATSQPGVAVHIDGVYQARTLTGGLGQMDLARIEALRGPQGTLYGRNATGGAVNFVTAAPSDRFEGSVLAGYASYDEYHLNGVVNVPVNEQVRTRLVVDYVDRREGFVKNVVAGGPDADKGSAFAARFKVNADLGPTLNLDLSVFYLARDGGFPWLQLNSPPSAAAVAGNPFLAGAVVPLSPHRFSADLKPDSELDTYGGAATVSVDLGLAQLKSITAYAWYDYRAHYDADGTNLAFSPEVEIAKSTTVSQEFNLGGEAGRLDWLVGAFYMDDTLKAVYQFDFPLGYPAAGLVPGGRLTTASFPYRVKTAAVFTDNIFNVTDRFRLIAGARYSEDKVESRSSTIINGVQVAPGVVLPTLITCNNVASDPSFHSFTPRAGLQYDITSDVGSYATVSRGFKNGGVNGCDDVYQPEKITAYETGLRMQFLDRALTVNPTIFYYDYTGFQVTQIRGLESPVINAPKATVMGFELESAWRATEHLTFNGTLTLLDAQYGNGFTNTDTLNLAAGVQNLDGKRLNRAPKRSASLGAEYRTAMTEQGRLTLRGDVYVSSRIYFREFNTALDSQAAYQVVNLNLTWDSPDERYAVRAYVNNAGDEAYLAQVGASDAYGARFSSYAPPRQVGVELRAKF